MHRTGQSHHLVGGCVPHAMRRMVVVEGDSCFFLEGVGDVRAAGFSALTEGHIPRSSFCDLVFVVAGGQGKCGCVDAGRVTLQCCFGAFGRPVGITTHYLVMVTRDCHQEVITRSDPASIDRLSNRVLVCRFLLWFSPGSRESAPHQRERGAHTHSSPYQRPVVWLIGQNVLVSV